jgi:hypothetical protein
MQRNRLDQKPLTWLLFAALFIPYEALAMHYLYLPPLFGVLFFLYIKALETKKSLPFFIIVFMLMIAETSKGYLLLSTLFFFTVCYFALLPKLKSTVSCRLCLNAIIVLLAYLGYWAFAALFAKMFALPLPQLDYRVVFYMFIEFFLIGLI